VAWTTSGLGRSLGWLVSKGGRAGGREGGRERRRESAFRSNSHLLLSSLSPSLFADYRFEVMGLLMHAHHLDRTYGTGPHTISIPRMQPALNAPAAEHIPMPVNDDDFKKLVAVIRCAVPYTGKEGGLEGGRKGGREGRGMVGARRSICP